MPIGCMQNDSPCLSPQESNKQCFLECTFAIFLHIEEEVVADFSCKIRRRDGQAKVVLENFGHILLMSCGFMQFNNLFLQAWRVFFCNHSGHGSMGPVKKTWCYLNSRHFGHGSMGPVKKTWWFFSATTLDTGPWVQWKIHDVIWTADDLDMGPVKKTWWFFMQPLLTWVHGYSKKYMMVFFLQPLWTRVHGSSEKYMMFLRSRRFGHGSMGPVIKTWWFFCNHAGHGSMGPVKKTRCHLNNRRFGHGSMGPVENTQCFFL
jgi:hypothetical protein